jgi:translation initiation factor IF-3
LVSEDGEQIGIRPLPEALGIARDLDLDLVEVAPNANPPVCRIMDYGRYVYEQEQRRRQSKRKATNVVIKEMKFRPKIDEHDFQFKRRNAERFLLDGNKVKSTVIFRGREMAHNEIGRRILNRLASELLEVALIEVPPRQEGMTMVQILSPKKEPPKPVRASKKADGDGKQKAEKSEKAEKAPRVKKPEAAEGGRPEKQTS